MSEDSVKHVRFHNYGGRYEIGRLWIIYLHRKIGDHMEYEFALRWRTA